VPGRPPAVSFSEGLAAPRGSSFPALLGAIGDVLYAVFLMPGTYLLSAFVATAPVTALKLGITAGQTGGTLPVVLSLIFWFALMILLSIVWRVFRNWLRMVNAMLRTLGFRLTLATRTCKIAEQLPLLPSKIQQSLDKLRRNTMLDSSIGSTDGFDNYRLTEAGATYVSIWQRQQSRG